jgi:hypothetical protein
VEDGDDFEAMIAETRSHLPKFLGLGESEALALAEQLDLELRVLHSPGQPVTLDYRPRRVTVDVSTGSVTQASAG